MAPTGKVGLIQLNWPLDPVFPWSMKYCSYNAVAFQFFYMRAVRFRILCLKCAYSLVISYWTSV